MDILFGIFVVLMAAAAVCVFAGLVALGKGMSR